MKRPSIVVWVCVISIITSFTGGCSAAPLKREPVSSPNRELQAEAGRPTYWPGDDWRISTSEEQALNSALILELLQTIQKRNLAIHSLLIIRHGYLVTEVYFPPYEREVPHPVFSVTKSVTSALVGIAIEEGYIKGVQQKVLDFFPDIAQDVTDKYLKDLTVEHLLTMSAGYLTNTMPNLRGKEASFDTVRHILTYNSILVKPGSSFFYDSGGPHLLAAIIQKSTGLTLQEYAQKKLFGPLGITAVGWETDPQGITKGATGLKITPRDMAKIGYLYLQHGQWNGTQIVPAQWVDVSTTKHFDTQGLMNAAEDDGYGYLWWMDAFGGYSAHGFGGQYIFVLPQLDMVVVFTSGLTDANFPTPSELLTAYLLPAAQSPHPLVPNPPAFQRLQTAIQKIEKPETPVAPLPEVARQISGKPYQITASSGASGGLEQFTLTFAEGNLYQEEAHWSNGQTAVALGGLNNLFHLNKIHLAGAPAQTYILVPLRGYWQDDHTFVEQYVLDPSADIQLITEKYTFEGDSVTIEATSSMDLFSFQVKGEMRK